MPRKLSESRRSSWEGAALCRCIHITNGAETDTVGDVGGESGSVLRSEKHICV